MAKLRPRVASFTLICLCGVWLAGAQEASHENTPPKDLDLVSVGDGWLPNGNKTATRVYAAPNGDKGQVLYTRFDSLQAAQRQIEEWVKATPKVTDRQKNQTIRGQLISDRTVGSWESPKEFVIIRRDGLNCYLIESSSLKIALQIEILIEHKNPQK